MLEAWEAKRGYGTRPETHKERVQRYRERAEATREQATKMKDMEAKATMAKTAALWDEMADLEEHQSSWPTTPAD